MSALGFTAEQVKQVAELSSKITHEVNAGRIATLESELAQLRAEVERLKVDSISDEMLEAGKEERMKCFDSPLLNVGQALSRIYLAMRSARKEADRGN